jgi:RNA polymerase sigma-70 factor (ECF subfamily)
MNKHVDNDDFLLVKECLNGSEKAWQEFYSRFIILMRNVIRRHGGFTSLEMDDVTQSAFLSLTSALQNYDGKHPLSSFVCLITQRVLIDEIRKMKAVKRESETEPIDHHDSLGDGLRMVPSGVETADVQIERFENAEALRTAMERIDSDCRELLSLRYLGEMPFSEIATVLGVTENTLNVRAGRCLNKLRTAYKELETRGNRAWKTMAGNDSKGT